MLKTILTLSVITVLAASGSAMSQATQTILETTDENPTYTHGWEGAGGVIRWERAGAVIIKNHWKPEQYLNIQFGPLAAGTIQPGWLSARWTLEPVDPGSTLYRIRNVWKPEQYLNIQFGPLAAGTIQPGWLSAMWKIDPVIFLFGRDVVQGKLFPDFPTNHAKLEWTQVLNPEQEYDNPLVGLSGRVIVLEDGGLSKIDNPFLHPFGYDWEFFIAPDIGYLNLAAKPRGANGEYVEAVAKARSDFGLDVPNMVGVETDRDLIPLPYRPQRGDRVAVWGRWIVDTGHPDYHTEIHPPLLVATGRADSPNETTTTVIGRPYLVGQRWSDGPFFEHLVKEVAKIPVLSLRAEAHPTIMPKAFHGKLHMSYTVKPPSPRINPLDRLMVRFRFTVRTGVSAQVVGSGDAVTVNIAMNDQLYRRAALPRRCDLVVKRSAPTGDPNRLSCGGQPLEVGVASLSDKAGDYYIGIEILQGLQTAGIAAIILERGVLTDRYVSLIQPKNPDRGQFADLPVNSLSGPTASSNAISVDDGQPYPIYGTLKLRWERAPLNRAPGGLRLPRRPQ